MYADISTVYIDFYTYDVARKCITTALVCGEKQPMEDFFYEYCYVQLAEIEARLGNTEEALKYKELSLEWDNDSGDFMEYQSMDLRRSLISASAALKEGDYETAGTNLDAVTDEIGRLDSLPADILWVSDIYYPYLEHYIEFYLAQQEYEAALDKIEVMFAAGAFYGRMDNLMNFLTGLINILPDTGEAEMLREVQSQIEEYIQLYYPNAYQQKNMTAGTHIFNSNMATNGIFI